MCLWGTACLILPHTTPFNHLCSLEMSYNLVCSVSEQELLWCVCVFGEGGRWVFGTQSIDWWSKLGGPGLTERRSVSGNICPQLSAVWSIPAQWWAREALLLIKRSHRYAHRLNSFYGSVFTHILKYLYKVEKASLHLNVLVWDELLKTHCWVYEGELSVCFVSLCQGDFTTVIWLISSSTALQIVFYSLLW